MFQALYNSLSGLFSFSKSLDTVSNNVANMNTPGFRGSDSFFENLAGEHGTRIVGAGLRTTAGDLRQTGNATDVAVDGSGYFVLRDSTEGCITPALANSLSMIAVFWWIASAAMT